jgi:hypothetical protein
MKKIVSLAVLGIFSLIVLFSTAIFQSCTENQRVRSFGGSETINLPAGQRLVNATWKGEKGAADLWILTEPMDSTYVSKTKKFEEHSGYGIINGSVIFVESK